VIVGCPQFGGTCCLRLQLRAYWGSMFYRNIVAYQTAYRLNIHKIFYFNPLEM